MNLHFNQLELVPALLREYSVITAENKVRPAWNAIPTSVGFTWHSLIGVSGRYQENSPRRKDGPGFGEATEQFSVENYTKLGNAEGLALLLKIG
jgi:hypothetical protein